MYSILQVIDGWSNEVLETHVRKSSVKVVLLITVAVDVFNASRVLLEKNSTRVQMQPMCHPTLAERFACAGPKRFIARAMFMS